MVKKRERLTLHALLIGIDCYLPNQLPNGLYYKNLSGCVRDILRIEEFLRNDLGVPSERILKLTSSKKSTDYMPLEPPEQWPTYENIIMAFRKLESLTEAGDQVYIHYSGHGGRTLTTTAFRDIKGPGGIDQVLVPMDLGDSEGRYLRDHELQYLLQMLVDKDLLVTVVLDCCHAGGLTRGVKLEVQGYTLLSACSASEYARECAFDAKVTHGALTYWLLECFQQIGPGFTYKMLHDRLLAKVHGQFEGQTPQLHGNGNREVFGNLEWPMQTGVTVIQVHPDEILLNAGQAHGLTRGTQFGVFTLFETDISRISKSIAIVEIIETEATTSRARIASYLCPGAIEPGAQAVLVDLGPGLRRRVRPTSQTEADLPALKELKQLLDQTFDGFLTLARNDDVADYCVTVTLDGEFIICDGLGRSIPNLKPSLLIKDRPAPSRLLERLVHLTRYFHVRELYNNVPHSKLAGALLIGVFPEGNIAEERLGERVLTPHEITVNDGEWVRLRVRNKSSAVLNITALELRPDWTIKQVYPTDASSFEPLDPEREIVLSVRISLPADYESGKIIIKVFGTLRATSFRWLELAALNSIENENCKPSVAGVPNRLQDSKLIGSNPLLITGKSAMRGMTVPWSSCDEWLVQEVKIQIQRATDEPTGKCG